MSGPGIGNLNPEGGGQRESMAKLEPIDLNGDFRTNPPNRVGSLLTQDLTTGFEPRYRGSNAGSKKVKLSVDDDPWAIKDLESTSKPWRELTTNEKWKRVGVSIFKIIAVITLLYFFVCSLDCLSLGFRLVGGRTTGQIFSQSDLLKNPIVGVMIGILTTVLVQSSSTSSSIIVSMVSADFLDVKMAIPIIMGANIGTSVTNTIVSLTQAGDRNQFRRAFAGATVHDMFNWLSVIVLLIIEVTTGYLYHLTSWVMEGIPNGTAGGEVEILSVITDPFVDLIVQLDKEVLDCWALDCPEAGNLTLLKEDCSSTPEPDKFGSTIAPDFVECDFLFAKFGLGDVASGAILLVASLAVLCGCLILIVKVLQSVMRGQIANVIRTTLNAKVPYVPWITGYLALVVGAVMTFLVQSSSVFTSTLTPLVGLGVISVERVYPLTLGSNIGTTTTALLASLAVEGEKFKDSLQVALCHLFFNISGIILFYPIPFMRFPIGMAKFLGDTTANYRWFAIAYMIFMFLLLPAVTMGLSVAGTIYVIVFAVIVVLIFGMVITINFIQDKKPQWLPKSLQTWDFLPAPLRSLEPYDRVFTRWKCCQKLKSKSLDTENERDNPGFESSDEDTNRQPKTNDLSLVHVESKPSSKNGNFNPAFTE